MSLRFESAPTAGRRASFRRALALLSAVAAAMAAPPSAALAQGFFQSLFGGGRPQQAAPAPAARQALPPLNPGLGHRAPLYNPSLGRERPVEESDAPRDRGGAYRTMCVRLCDGYYWPISQSVRRGSFYRDALACRASCGQEAKLFYHASSSGNASEMIDQQGKPYTSLPNAFRYRKKLVEGCRCRPEAWAESELNRHRVYALHAADERARRERLATFSDPSRPDEATEKAPGQIIEQPIVIAGAAQVQPRAAETRAVEAPARAEGMPAEQAHENPEPPALGHAAVPAVAVAPAAAPVEQPARGGRRASADRARATTRLSTSVPRPRPAAVATARTALPAPSGLGGPQRRWPGD